MLWHGKNFRGVLNKAVEVLFNKTGTTLNSTNVQDAISEIDGNLNNISGLIRTGYDTDYFDDLYLYYCLQGHVVTVTGIVHATQSHETWIGKQILPQNILPRCFGDAISAIALNTTTGNLGYVGTSTGSDLVLANFPYAGWYRFSFSYIVE